MMLFRRVLFVVGSTSFVATCAQAQNLIQNPYFDDELMNWEYSPAAQVSWTASVDYPVGGSSKTGSMKLDGAATPSIAYQCIPVVESTDYVASMRVNSHCAGQRLYIFWTDATCIAGDTAVTAASVRSDQWDRVSVSGVAPAGSSYAIVAADNPGGTCRSPAFIDDVVFETDSIFADGFEPPSAP